MNFTTETVNPEWQNSFPIVARISRPATSITVPARTGSYLIKAKDKSGNFSPNEAIITTNITSIGDLLMLQQQLNIQILQEQKQTVWQ